jgi:mono/diheme cytochrome c family protein
MKTLSLTLIITLTFAAGSHADEAQKENLMTAGKALFATCMGCHGPDGKGIAAGASKMAPPLSGSPFVTGDPAILALVVTKGIVKENQNFLGMMTPMEGIVPSDEKLAALLTYIRNSFDNKASVVTEEDAKRYREQWKDIKTPQTRAKLTELEEASKK